MKKLLLLILLSTLMNCAQFQYVKRTPENTVGRRVVSFYEPCSYLDSWDVRSNFNWYSNDFLFFDPYFDLYHNTWYYPRNNWQFNNWNNTEIYFPNQTIYPRVSTTRTRQNTSTTSRRVRTSTQSNTGRRGISRETSYQSQVPYRGNTSTSNTNTPRRDTNTSTTKSSRNSTLESTRGSSKGRRGG